MNALLAQYDDGSGVVLVLGLIFMILVIWLGPALLASLGKSVGAKPAAASWGRAFLALILCAVVEFVIGAVLTFVAPGLGTLISFVISALIDSMIVALIFEIDPIRGFVVILVFDIIVVVAIAVVALLLVVLAGVSLEGLMWQLGISSPF